MLVATLLIMVAGPVMADDKDRHDRRDDRQDFRHDLRDDFFDHDFDCDDCDDFDDIDVEDLGFFPFIGFSPFVSVLDDLDIEQVGNNNPLEGSCVATDLDFDGFIAEWEVTCFV